MIWQPISTALFVLYGVVTLFLGATGLYYGVIAIERLVRDTGTPASPPTFDEDAERPPVTLQIPVYNERHVVGRLLDSVAAFDWPAAKLQVQVIDDSTDETAEVVESGLARLREQGVATEHVRREERRGYKAGAVDDGLETATGEFVALFDADFVPASDFLERTIPHFEDPTVGCVQTRWTHLNESYSWFTRAQALALDAHFAVEQWVRARAGSLMSFNATACVWRRETLDAAGGWSAETVAEDLDLTAEALLDGWRFVYTEGYAVPCEIPATLSSFVRQQTRWARGSAQNVRKHLGRLLRNDRLSGWATFHSVLHIGHYLFYPLLLLWMLLHVLVAGLGESPDRLLLVGFAMTTPGPLAFLALGQVMVDREGRLRRLAAALPLTLVGAGIAWRMSKAVVSGLVETGGSFSRTPKFGENGPRRAWSDRAYDRPLGSVLPETLLGGWCVGGAALAVLSGVPRMGVSVGFFAVAFALVVAIAVRQRAAR